MVDVPTREEFDAQSEKIAELENRIVYIETLIEQVKIGLKTLTEMLYPMEA